MNKMLQDGTKMKDVGPQRLPNLKILLIGVGTVFGTLGVILAVMFGWTFVMSHETADALSDSLTWLIVYGSVGSVLAFAICIVAALPMWLLWIPIFARVHRNGCTLRLSAMLTAGGLSLIGTVAVCAVAETMGAAHFPPMFWPFILVPISISVLLAYCLSYDRNGVALG